jgi:hypothetical protein
MLDSTRTNARALHWEEEKTAAQKLFLLHILFTHENNHFLLVGKNQISHVNSP